MAEKEYQEYSVLPLLRKLHKLKPPKDKKSYGVCTDKHCCWKPLSGGRCVLPGCFKKIDIK